MPDDNERGAKEEPLEAYWNDVRQPDPNPLPERELARQHPGDLVIGTSEKRVLVRIHPDGSLTYGPEYTPDEAAVTFWTEMARRRLETDQRLIQFQAQEHLLAMIAEADLAYEAAQRRALAEGASEHDRFMVEMSRRNLEARVHQLIEFARGLLAARPDLRTPPREPR